MAKSIRSKVKKKFRAIKRDKLANWENKKVIALNQKLQTLVNTPSNRINQDGTIKEKITKKKLIVPKLENDSHSEPNVTIEFEMNEVIKIEDDVHGKKPQKNSNLNSKLHSHTHLTKTYKKKRKPHKVKAKHLRRQMIL